MKKIVMILAMAATVTFGYAQDDKKCCENCDKQQPPTTEQMTQKMAEQLGLNDQQTQQLQALNAEYADVLEGARRHGGHGPQMRRGPRRGHGEPGNHGFQQPQQLEKQDGQAFDRRPPMRIQRIENGENRKEKMEQVKARRAEYEQKVQQILTKEQYEKMQQMRPQHGMRGAKAPMERQDRKMMKKSE